MPAAAAHHPSHAGQSSAGHFPIPVYARQNNSDGNDLEPNEEWKTALHKRVEDDLRYMITDADNQRDVELAKAPLERERIEKEHLSAHAYIRTIAMEQYHYQLKKERNQRRWLAGIPVDSEWSEIFVKEQQQIMDTIKQSTGESPVEGRSSPPPATPSPRPTSTSQETIPSRPSSLQQKLTAEDRKETPSASRPIRRPSDAHRNAESSTSHEPEERRRTASSSGSIGRRHTRDRSVHPTSQPIVVEPEDTVQMPPAVPIPPPSTSPSSSRQRLHSQSSDKPPSSPSERMESALGRSSGSIRSVRSDRSTRASPAPEMWKPSVNPTEDTISPSTPPPAPPPSSSAKSVNLGRRGSTASIRSTGSGASIRPSITETIPEKVDGVMEDEALEKDALQLKTIDNSSGASSKRRLSVKQEKWPQRRRDSKSSIPDSLATRHDEPHLSRPPSVSAASSSTFSNYAGPSSATMQYATSSSPGKPSSLSQQYPPPGRVLSPSGSNSSFPVGGDPDRYYSPVDRPPKSAPYTEPYQSPPSRSAPRDRDYAYAGPRDSPYSARPSHPPPQARPPYGDEREYAYSPMGRASEPISPFSDYQSSHASVSHKSSFIYGREREQRESWDRDGYRERDDQHFRGSNDWDDDRDRMREKDRDLDYRDQREYEPRHSRYSGGPYSSRPPSYPTPPSSAGRHGGSMEYLPMHELLDERDKDWEEPVPPPREREREHGSYPYHRTMPPQNDDYDYPRNPDGASPRPSGPMRQPSYSRRESEETSNRRMTSDNIDNYSSRHPSGPPHTSGSIPISRPPPLADGTNPRPAWSKWATEGGALSTLSYARSPPPSTPSNDPYGSPRQRRRSGQQLPPTYLPQQSQLQSQQIQPGYRDGAYPTVYAPMSRAQSPSRYGHAAPADVRERQMAPVNAKTRKRLAKMERGEADEYTDSDSNEEGEEDQQEEGMEGQQLEDEDDGEDGEEEEEEEEEDDDEGDDDDEEEEEGESDHAGLTDLDSDRRELILSASSGASGSEEESEEAEDEELIVEMKKPSIRTQLPPRSTNTVQAPGRKLLSRTTVNLSEITASRGPTNDALRNRLQRETEEAKIRDSTLSDAKRLINMKKKELERARQEEKKIEQLAEQREAQKRAAEKEAKNKSEQMKAKKQEEARLKQEREEEAARLKEEARVREEEAAKLREAARLAEEEAARLAQEEEEEAERLVAEEAARLEEEEEERAREEARLEEEKARKEEERLEQERKEEERKVREEEIRQKELEALRKAEEAKKKELEIKQMENDLKKKTDEAKKLEKDAARKAEQAKRKETEVNRKEEATKVKEAKLKEVAEKTKKMQQEAAKIAEEAREKQANLRRLEEETRKKEQEIQEREQALALREEELRRREEEAKQKEEEAKLKEQEANLKELEAREKEAETQRKAREEALYRRTEEINKREAEAKRKEDEMKRKERDSKLKAQEEAKRKAEQEEASKETLRRAEVAARAEQMRLENEQKRQQQEAEKRQREEEFDLMNEGLSPGFIEQQIHLFQQLEYAKREEEIKRQREERRRTDSLGSSSPSSFVPSSSPSVPKYFTPAYNGSSASDASSIHSTATSASRSSASSAWSYSTKASSIPPPTTPRPAVNVPLTNKPRTGSVSGSFPRSASPPPPTFSETEWTRRQEQFAKDQQERFQREQEKMEAERQMRSAGRPLSREDLQRLFDHHDRMWAKLPSPDNTRLTWADIPWPMTRPPSGPDDLTFAMISSYFLSPFWPETKSTKDRIKDHLRRWHPDRFETKTLPKVVDSDQERVKLGAGMVSRHLNELLRKENESRNGMSPFGD